MIAANDEVGAIAELRQHDTVQLRLLIAHAAGLLAHKAGHAEAGRTLTNVLAALGGPKQKLSDIAADVAERHNLSVADLRGPRRTQYICDARHEAFYIAFKTGAFTRPQIGRYFGNRDHTTVDNGIARFKARLAQ